MRCTYTLPKNMRFSYSPNKQMRCACSPKKQIRFSYSPNKQMRFSYSPKKQIRFSYSPNKQMRCAYSPKKQMRFSYSPNKQMRCRAYFNSLNGGTNVPPLSGFVPPRKCVPPLILRGGFSFESIRKLVSYIFKENITD